MRKHADRPVLGSFVVGLAVLLMAMAGRTAAEVAVSEARVPYIPGDVPLAGYFSLRNDGDAVRTLVGARSAAFGRITVRRSTDSEDQAQMQRVARLVVAPGNQVNLKPGGLHLVLMERKSELSPGGQVTIELRFDDGEIRKVRFQVVNSDAG